MDATVSTDQIIISLTFFVYLLLLLVIGWTAYTRTRGLDDFILGGRRLGSWTAALSAGASDMSGWLLLGLPGFAYLSGMESVWLATSLIAGTWLNWLFMAAPLRSFRPHHAPFPVLEKNEPDRCADRNSVGRYHRGHLETTDGRNIRPVRNHTRHHTVHHLHRSVLSDEQVT